jgi:hypothetical protein
MMLLATYMKKNQWEHEKATNGLLALQAFRASPQGFDVIFMGMCIEISFSDANQIYSVTFIFITSRHRD